MFEGVDHVGVATRSIDAALETLMKIGPVRLGKLEEIPAFQVRALMAAAGGAPIELIEPASPQSAVARFLDSRGEGLHHVAFRVRDIHSALQSLRQAGFRLIDENPRPGYAGSRVAFLHPKSVFGVLTELVQREPGRDVPPYDPQ